MWFETLTGFSEESPEQVRKNISVAGEILKSFVNDREYICGILERPSLAELRNRVRASDIPAGRLTVREKVADVQDLHRDKANAGALFQVASQFNLLEMVGPGVTPEQGVSGYAFDPTQGPACAVAAGAGTIYRNYFAEVNGKTGQSADNQIDGLADIGTALGNEDNRLWEMKNGYGLATENGLLEITERLKSSTEAEIDDLRKLLRIGVQWDTEVTISDAKQTVCQAYCSAMPVAYSHCSTQLWSAFAGFVLEASYEAAICTGILNFLATGNNSVYLTLLGGGAFGNERDWIINAIQRSLQLYENVGIDVAVVSHGRSNPDVRALIR